MVIVPTMPLRKADAPLEVRLPSASDDRPSWTGVGAIAVLGFAVGVAWPKLAGVRLGPSVPDAPLASSGAGEPAAPSSGPSPSFGPGVPAAIPAPAVTATPLGPGPAPSGASPGEARVTVAHGSVFACKTAGGESLKGSGCGAVPGLDAIVQPRLHKLADCPEAASTSGKLHLVVKVDFAHDGLTVDLGRDHGVATAEPLLACARSALSSASLQGLTHENARYSVAYAVTFGGAALTAPPATATTAAPPPSAEGTAQVEWEVGIVRDAPRTSGKVLARLPRGTTLRVGAAKDGWYPIKYGDGFSNDGWLYRGAIGR
jgi:hypothetical protein